jgi:outer membrane protein assembly factor BamB
MGRIYSPLVGTGDRIYIAGLSGKTYVIKNGTEFEVLAQNKLDEGTSASPIIVGDELYLRGTEHLYCIAAN